MTIGGGGGGGEIVINSMQWHYVSDVRQSHASDSVHRMRVTL